MKVGGRLMGFAYIAAQWSLDRVMREIEKCIIVCANCHAEIHAGFFPEYLAVGISKVSDPAAGVQLELGFSF